MGWGGKDKGGTGCKGKGEALVGEAHVVSINDEDFSQPGGLRYNKNSLCITQTILQTQQEY